MLKKSLFVFAITTFTCSLLQSQAPLGFDFGAAFSNFTKPSNEAPGATNKTFTGFSAEAYLSLPLSDDFSFQPAIQYLQKGTLADITDPDPSLVRKTIITHSYVELPLLLRYRIGGDNFRWYALAGPDFGYLVSAKSEITDSPWLNGTFDDKQYYQTYEISFAIGVGLEYPISPALDVVTGLRYYHGISTITKPPAGSGVSSEGRSRTIQLSFGIGIHP